MALILGLHMVFHGPAHGKELYKTSCLLVTDAPIGFTEASIDPEWDCSPRFNAANTGHSWQKINLSGAAQGHLMIETASAAVTRIRIIAVDKQGHIHRRTFDDHALSKYWMPGNSVALPVPLTREYIAQLYVAIDGDPNPLPVTEISIRPEADVATERLIHSVLYALACAVLLTVALFSVFMGLAVGNHTVALHGVFSALAAFYTASASSLIFLLFSDLTLWSRTALSYASLAIAMSLLGPIMLTYFESRIFNRKDRILIFIGAGAAALSALALPLSQIVEYNARLTYNLLFLPGIIIILRSIFIAWRQGSRAVAGFLLAWIAPITLGIERVLRGAELYYLPDTVDSLFFIGLAAQALIMLVVIALQAEAVRRERDQAHDRARAMADEALTDSLTGLPNRRDFDARIWRRSDVIAIIDLDHFKPINDTWGHAVGDEVLQAVGRALADGVARGELLRAWRLGGEEFGVAIANSRIGQAAMALNTVRDRIAAEVRSAVPQIDRPVTASAGLARIDEEGMRQAYRAADAALYRAKAGGRNRLCYENSDRSVATIFPRPQAA